MERLALMPKYEAYKDSGVEWLGDIPSSWELKPGFVAFCESKSNNKGMKENTVLSLSYGNIVVKPEEKLVGLVPESFETYQLVEPDDIIVRCTDLQNDKVSLRTGLAKNKGIITSAYLNLRAKSGFDARFLHYYLYSLDTTKVLYKFGSGLRQNLSFLDFKRLPIFEIPEDTQKLISNYLDKKTAQIDDAIAIKEQQISLLKERKQIIIQQAVTQGLDPNVPMKDSGVDWIGDIPEHWEVVPLKRLAVLSPSVKVSNRKSKELVTFLAMEKVSTDGFIDQDTLMPICDVSQGFTVFNRGDVIVAKITPCFENGKSAWLNNLQTEFGYGSTEFHVLRCGQRIIGSFLYLIVSSPLFLNAGEAMMTGSAGQKRVPSSFIQNFPTAIPGVAEQEKIVSKVKELFSQIDVVVASTVNQIEKLKEYKTTLINSAVTGKIKITPEMVEQ
ncbi:restriction endonuclease subunit S [Providencia rettgeri]|uniref:restriction endonuclease subunit S n=1 Tax=Providencia rettgeri TaxID=587 RepID=UPI001CFDBC51|nr:restriction endonuclease subunit S [Providencia rettgeri]EMB0750571.1 restriction endonuclease subunit S [Providencia rettgeri]MCB4842810.1 restriction endonuclease subunit S [Providencia rettgeri]